MLAAACGKPITAAWSDSGANKHCVDSQYLEGLTLTDDRTSEPVVVTCVGGTEVIVTRQATVLIKSRSCKGQPVFLELQNVLIADGIDNFLISTVLLEKAGGQIFYDTDGSRFVHLNGDSIPVDIVNGVYSMLVRPLQSDGVYAQACASGAKPLVSAKIWHERLLHAGLDKLHAMRDADGSGVAFADAGAC